MKEVYQPHDKFFKELMSRKKSALDFLRYYLPEEIVNQLDLPTGMPARLHAFYQQRFGGTQACRFVDKELAEHFAARQRVERRSLSNEPARWARGQGLCAH